MEVMKSEEAKEMAENQMGDAVKGVMERVLKWRDELLEGGMEEGDVVKSVIATGYVLGVMDAAKSATQIGKMSGEVPLKEWGDFTREVVRNLQSRRSGRVAGRN